MRIKSRITKEFKREFYNAVLEGLHLLAYRKKKEKEENEERTT